MKKALVIFLFLLTAVSLAASTQGTMKLVLSYTVLPTDISFRLVHADVARKGQAYSDDKVSQILLGNISPLNHGEKVLSQDAYLFLFGYNLPSGDKTGYYFGNFSLQVECPGLQLNGMGDYLVNVKFVNLENTDTAVEWPLISMRELGSWVPERPYGDPFKIELTNGTSGRLKVGPYTGVIKIAMTTF